MKKYESKNYIFYFRETITQKIWSEALSKMLQGLNINGNVDIDKINSRNYYLIENCTEKCEKKETGEVIKVDKDFLESLDYLEFESIWKNFESAIINRNEEKKNELVKPTQSLKEWLTPAFLKNAVVK